jgi:hypothetical protein
MGTTASMQAEVHDSACANAQHLHIEDRRIVDSSIEGNSVPEKERTGRTGCESFWNGVMDNMVCGISVLSSNAFDGCEHEHERDFLILDDERVYYDWEGSLFTVFNLDTLLFLL